MLVMREYFQIYLNFDKCRQTVIAVHVTVVIGTFRVYNSQQLNYTTYTSVTLMKTVNKLCRLVEVIEFSFFELMC